MHSDLLMFAAIKVVSVCDANQCLKMRWLVIFLFIGFHDLDCVTNYVSAYPNEPIWIICSVVVLVS